MYRLICSLLFLSILSGCSLFPSKAPVVKSTSAVEYHTHNVKLPGETLGAIALWYTGKLENWKTIQRYNPNIKLKRIQMGDKIRIPLNLLKQQKPLPQSLIAKLERGSSIDRKVNTAVESSDLGTDSFVLPQPVTDSPERIGERYHYKVSKISGCESLGNSLDALEECASKFELEQNIHQGREL